MNALEVRNLTKTFGSTIANHDISLELKKGEILALLGENGSGKSTFVNQLAGIYAPESGEIFIDGKKVEFKSPQDAISAGVGMVHQHFKLVEVMSALENITLGEKSAGFFVKKQQLYEKINEIQKKFGFSIDLNRKLYEMSVSEKQTVEIIKILYQGARILILDEPTAVLTPQETEKLFVVLRRMKENGCSIIIITHKLNEVMEISDRVAVMRKGENAGLVETSSCTEKSLARLMLGGKFEYKVIRVAAGRSQNPVLVVKNLSSKNAYGKKSLDNLNFDLYGGEILGVAGIVGSGQKELCETLTGLLRAESGEAIFQGQNLLKLSPIEIKKLGVRMNFVPEDRLGMGLAAGLDITENVMMRSYSEESHFFLDRKKGSELATDIVDRYGIATPSIHNPVRQLSGGNIQKVLLGRELEMHPKFLIVAYPFRGLDVGATNNIINMLNEQKKKGVAILLIGEDIDQLCALCDRLMVIHDGSIKGIVNPEQTTKENIGLMMMGKSVSAEKEDENA
ncbi:MAG: ABC transporter ATP-binding protein [Treponema sp.]|jgi:simple sugar transport system ATP-binding protein|uniref:ABC transporter ATP-binding protein n=1 Tax=Treponema sp. TaxID=166 RepID=UPI002A90FCD5|nr:ABC transporter ATP-binding protein [Treponema sp.]MDY6397147.1 ABC transporter ATP-binding protein [Treponema sp.]